MDEAPPTGTISRELWDATNKIAAPGYVAPAARTCDRCGKPTTDSSRYSCDACMVRIALGPGMFGGIR